MIEPDCFVLVLILAISLPLSIVAGIYLHWRCHTICEYYAARARKMPWYYFALSTLFFLATAVASIEMPEISSVFFFVASFQLVLMVYQFLRHQVQFSIRDLFVATTLFAMLSALCRLGGMAIVPLFVAVSGVAILSLIAIESIEEARA